MQLRLTACAVVALCAAPLFAQTGVVDQDDPYPPAAFASTAGFNGSASSLVWQQQVRAGIAGQLEGVNLHLNGALGSTMNVRFRLGDGWNTSVVLFSTVITKQTASFDEVVFVNCASANILLGVGSTFVIEVQGNDDGGGFVGSHSNSTTATYPEELYLGPSATTCFADCLWRMAFTSYMLTSPTGPTPYCTSGMTTHGCAASISASANPSASLTTPCLITVDDVEGQKSGIVFYGLQALPQPWCPGGVGSSFLCVKPPTQRSLPQSSGGTNGACDGDLALDWNAFQQGTPGSLGAPWSSGDKVYVQAWFRDPSACRTTNLSNALEMTYAP